MNRIHPLFLAGISILILGAIAHAAQDVVIYGEGFAAVHETRTVSFSPEQTAVSLSLPAGLIGDSLWIQIADGEVPFSYQLVPGDDLTAALIGRAVEVVDTNGHLYRGTLRALSAGLVLEEADGRTVILDEFVRLRVSDPIALSTDPSVDIRIDGTVNGDMPITLLYLETGLTWETNYVVVLSPDETMLSLNATTTIANGSGSDLVEATVSLIAGDVNTVDDVYGATMRSAAVPLAYELDYSAAQAASEYYRYALSAPLTLADGASVTVPYRAASNVPVTKTYGYDGVYGGGVEVMLAFDNTADSGLGIPLPSGAVRVYTLGDGFLFLGSDSTSHVAAGASVDLEIGTAFDLSGEREILSRTEPTDDVYEETVEVTLTNHKSEAVTVIVTEHPSGTSWQMLEASHPYERVASNTIDFEVTVPASSTAQVTYTSQYTY